MSNQYVLVGIPMNAKVFNGDTAEDFVAQATGSNLCWDVTDRVSVRDGRTYLDDEDVSS